jgi:hypothetical protein
MQVTVNEQPTTESEGTEAPKRPAANGTVSITLQDGRQIGVRRMGPLDRMRMCSIIGAENSKNEIYLSMAVPAYCAASIDGDNVPKPQSVLALEAVAERLGDAALLQITLAIAENFPEADLTKMVEEFKKRQEIKNL